MGTADDDLDEDFLVVDGEPPEDPDEAELEELDDDIEEVDLDEVLDDDDEVLDVDDVLDDVVLDVVAPIAPARVSHPAPAHDEEEDDDDEEEADSDDVEASLDVILKERMIVIDDDDDDDEDSPEDDRPDSPLKVRPKQPGEFVCQSCFLVKHPSQLADREAVICRDCL